MENLAEIPEHKIPPRGAEINKFNFPAWVRLQTDQTDFFHKFRPHYIPTMADQCPSGRNYVTNQSDQ